MRQNFVVNMAVLSFAFWLTKLKFREGSIRVDFPPPLSH